MTDAKRDIPAAERLERSRRIPLGATCIFVLMMLAIWLMGRSIGGQYQPELTDSGMEQVLRDRP